MDEKPISISPEFGEGAWKTRACAYESGIDFGYHTATWEQAKEIKRWLDYTLAYMEAK